MTSINLIEFHDSRVGAVQLSGGNCVIEFAHLLVYHDVAPKRAEVWRYQARLELDGIESLVVVGTPPTNGAVVDGIVRSKDGNELSPTLLLERKNSIEIRIDFDSGATLTVNARHARILLASAIEKLDEFVDDD